MKLDIKQQKYYTFFQKQIIVMIGLSLIPGVIYVIFGWMNNIVVPVLIWYALLVLTSLYGWKLYKEFDNNHMVSEELRVWYKHLTGFMYVVFSLWTMIFILYGGEVESNLHYIAIFTQLGAAVVASALLVSDKKLFVPILLILMLPLTGYFVLFGTWYGYVLASFSLIFLGVLLYGSNNTYRLIQRNYYEAQHDALTGLYNRRYVIEYMETLLMRVKELNKRAYILLIDLDHFKTINDSLGHDTGDKVLQEVAHRIETFCHDSHIIARLGGDEFTVVSKEFDNKESLIDSSYVFSQRLLKIIKEPYIIDNHHLYISASIGINQIKASSIEVNQFIKNADIAMYEAKAQGRDGIIVFTEEMAENVNVHLEVEQKLYRALEEKKITVEYQPQFNSQEKMIGCEALVRWKDEEIGFISPEVFIPVAEETGLIVELGYYIVEEVFQTLEEWNLDRVVLKQVSINISLRHLLDSQIVERLRQLIDKHLFGYTNGQVMFELTETIFANDVQRVVKVMHELRSLGIKFSMDDFGTGYSSLSYLRDVPIDELKIDRSFIQNVMESTMDKSMVLTILSIAKNFNLKVVAEGIEKRVQLDFLIDHGCDAYQGFYFAKSLTKEKLTIMYLKG